MFEVDDRSLGFILLAIATTAWWINGWRKYRLRKRENEREAKYPGLKKAIKEAHE